MDTRTSMLLANMMTGSGGGVEFKSKVFATDDAYIQTDFNLNNVAKIRISGNLENYNWNNFSGTYSRWYQVFGSLKYSEGVGIGTIFAIEYHFEYNPAQRKLNAYLGSFSGGNFFSDSVSSLLAQGTDTTPKTTFDLTYSNITQNPDNTNIKIFKGIVYGTDTYINDFCAFSLIQLFDSSDNLLHELKPAIVNGESGMYDTVTETFYGNANSVGSLVCE